MSKRLSKRQQRELEELEQLKALQSTTKAVDAALDPPSTVAQSSEAQDVESKGGEEEQSDEDDPDPPSSTGPINAFAALGGDDDEIEEESEEEEVTQVSTKKSKKKKSKKKKRSGPATPGLVDEDSAPSTPAAGSSKNKKGGSKKEFVVNGADDQMDEVDRALAELDVKYGTTSAVKEEESTDKAGSTPAAAGPSALGFRQLLSVDPKHLDADAELRRFFGSKVISATASSSKSHRAGPSAKLRYTISKPKPSYPPVTSLAGLGMRELSNAEVLDIRSSSLSQWSDPAEKWFTFEHAGVWREVTRQFLGAVRSHDPNQLMALLQVYPWHVDTLMQMSEVYRLQSDYAERALYALDRCLSPAFNVSSGACRLDFSRVENRPMFMALHRIISYLGRRGCWSTAFNFAKLLFSIDPMGDPHGAAFWLDFLAIKSGNHAWILSMFESQSEQLPVAVFQGYPGMAFAYALACRAREDSEKSKDRTASDHALREAILGFPQAILPLADKIGASVPGHVRSDPLCQIQAGYSDDPSCPIHLLSHIYAARSEVLWKEPAILSWFEKRIPTILQDLHRQDAVDSRNDVLRLVHFARDPFDEVSNIPLFICRHVLCSESTNFLGFLPSVITSRSFNAFDPIPPLNAISSYDDEYFLGLRSSRSRSNPLGRNGGGGAGIPNMLRDWLESAVTAANANPTGWRDTVRATWRNWIGLPAGQAAAAEDEREQQLEEILNLAEQYVDERRRQGENGNDEEAAGMPGGYPG